MVPERVAENVYVFTSKNYAEVNAGAVVGEEWAVLIDTLPFPEETLEIKEYVEGNLETPIRYVVNTHFHFDHSLGNCWFPDAVILGSAMCRDLLITKGRTALQSAREQNHALDEVSIRLPDVFFDSGTLSIRIDKRTLTLLPMRGHSPDGIGVLLEEDKVLFSGDAIMSVPTILDGDISDLIGTLEQIPDMRLENIIPGHGDVILRGEVEYSMEQAVNYLGVIEKIARKALRRKDPESFLREQDIEATGYSRILLNGLAPTLHYRNMASLYHRFQQEES